MRSPLWTRLISVGAIVATMGVSTACGGHFHVSEGPYGEGSLNKVPCVETQAGRNCGGLLPADRGLSDAIRLDKTTVAAGTRILGTLTVSNHNKRAIDLLYRGCRPSYGVALTNRSGLYGDLFTLPCNPHSLVIEPGSNGFGVVVFTTYDGCAPTGTTTAVQPRCTGYPKAEVPALPPGKYLAVLVGLNLALPPAPPVTVTLTRA